MRKKNLIRNFDLLLDEAIVKGHGIYLFTKNKKKYIDSTSGITGANILGWGNKEIESQMIRQLKKIPFIDYKYFVDENRERLAKLILSKAENNLDGVFFVGGAGSEACEASMKLSYQYHYAKGKKEKKWIISRKQSYHGSGSDAMSLGDRKNLKIFKNFFPKFRAKINEHNIYRHRRDNESHEEYAERSAQELESKILQIGPKKVCAFVAETIMGGLVGDVPPAKNYWKKVRKICDKYDVHLILDEVWCGTGTTGKSFCIDYDGITPDFLFIGKTLAAGYSPVSAVITKRKITDYINTKLGAIQISTTHQGHSLGISAALGVQKIIQNEKFLNKVRKNGEYFRKTVYSELQGNSFFKNIRGRGLRNSLEYNCNNNHLFGQTLTDIAKNKFNLILSAKWHRVTFSQAINISTKDLDIIIDKFLSSYKYTQNNWSKLKKKERKLRNYY